ncbi:MAG: hypothetical protein IIA14_08930 [SAR324 cluster bacterium]|nr:hypothetical protein [SAR324 cluster bacterium]
MSSFIKNPKRILPPRKSGNGGGEPTHEQIADAIRKFRSEGGLIRQLPPQLVGSRRLVGNRWGSAYENVLDF